jgi:hypothetical protein
MSGFSNVKMLCLAALEVYRHGHAGAYNESRGAGSLRCHHTCAGAAASSGRGRQDAKPGRQTGAKTLCSCRTRRCRRFDLAQARTAEQPTIRRQFSSYRCDLDQRSLFGFWADASVREAARAPRHCDLESNRILGRTLHNGFRSIVRCKYKERDRPKNEQPAAVSALTSHLSLRRTPPGNGYSPGR